MKKKYKEIQFDRNSSDFQFDIIDFQDLLKRKPADHSQFEFHKVTFYVILLITEGSGKYNHNFIDYSYKKGSLFSVRKDNIHKFYKSNAKGSLLIFNDDFILNHSNELDASNTFLLFNEMLASPKLELKKNELEEVLNFIKSIKEEFHIISDNYSPYIVRSLLQIVTTKLLRIKSKNNEQLRSKHYLSQFLEFQILVERHCAEHKKVSFYAQQMGLSTKTLSNITLSIIDKAAKAFIIEIVILHSKRLIINSTDSLTEIAYQMGFDEPTNFFKYFKRYTTLSPRQFREKHQKT